MPEATGPARLAGAGGQVARAVLSTGIHGTARRASCPGGAVNGNSRRCHPFSPARATRGPVLEKIEGLAVLASGEVLFVTDNDGVNDSSGETQLVRLGRILN